MQSPEFFGMEDCGPSTSFGWGSSEYMRQMGPRVVVRIAFPILELERVLAEYKIIIMRRYKI